MARGGGWAVMPACFFLHCAAVEAVSEPWEDTCGAEIYRGEMKARFLFCCRV